MHLLFTAFYAFFLHFGYYTPFAHKLLRFPLHIYYILSFAFNALHFPMNACFQETLLWPWGIGCILGLPHFELPLVWSVAIELCTSSIFIPWRKKNKCTSIYILDVNDTGARPRQWPYPLQPQQVRVSFVLPLLCFLRSRNTKAWICLCSWAFQSLLLYAEKVEEDTKAVIFNSKKLRFLSHFYLK